MLSCCRPIIIETMSNADRMSDLPDDLLHRILSFLQPITSQVSTSLLSRRWRNLWSTNPVIRLSPGEPLDINLDRRLIDSVIEKWQAPRLVELQVHLYSSCQLTRVINLAASRYVQHLSISYNDVMPPLFLTCCPSLVSLSLTSCKPPELPPEFRGFRSLKALHLTRCDLTDNMLSRLLSVCPLLEVLKLEWCNGLNRPVVSSQNLKTLVILDKYHFKVLVIASAPSLTTIQFRLMAPSKVIFEEDVPHLLGFSLHVMPKYTSGYNKTPYYWLMMIPRLSYVRILSIDLCMLKTLVDDGRIIVQADVFGNLKELHLDMSVSLDDDDDLLDAFRVFLERRPSIEKLCLKLCDGIIRCCDDIGSDDGDEDNDYGDSIDGGEPSCDEELEPCALPGLKIARLIGFAGNRNEMRLLGFLLRSAINLESLRLFCSWSVPKNILEQLHFCWCQKSPSSNASIMAGICLCDGVESSYTQPTTPFVQQITQECKMGDICSWHSGSQGFHPSNDTMCVYWIGKNNDTLPSGLYPNVAADIQMPHHRAPTTYLPNIMVPSRNLHKTRTEMIETEWEEEDECGGGWQRMTRNRKVAAKSFDVVARPRRRG